MLSTLHLLPFEEEAEIKTSCGYRAPQETTTLFSCCPDIHCEQVPQVSCRATCALLQLEMVLT